MSRPRQLPLNQNLNHIQTREEVEEGYEEVATKTAPAGARMGHVAGGTPHAPS